MALGSFVFQGQDDLKVLWEDGERVFCRGWGRSADGSRCPVLVLLPVAESPPALGLDRFAHEYALKAELDAAWSLRPLELVREGGRSILVLEDANAEPLDRLLGGPMEIGRFLQLAVGITVALGKAHERGLLHKDIKPANIMVNCADGGVRLTGFGIASRLLRERQSPDPPETIAGTFGYMSPEQTGRMNRSVDSRSDLYSLGITFYQMITGALPFNASDAMEWVHCHIARQPVPPSERRASVPGAVSQIIMKLLAKTAEERYQTAGGVEYDLRRCLEAWEGDGRIEQFVLAERDTPDRLLIPEKLYGREREVATLLAAFDRIIKSGVPELVLVSGYSGIGKSSVVNELHKVLVPPRGLFASGKFDQYKRDIPYATLAQAFQSLVRVLLVKSNAELSRWRDDLLEVLDPNAQLMVDLVPELKLIIGQQPPVPELEPQLAQTRFQLVLRRFIGVFARPEHPLALFLDDLQWLDAATLDLLEELLTRSDLQHLVLIGAYRDNEVTSAHPLMRKVEAIKTAGGKIAEIRLTPLAREHVGQLIAETLRCKVERAAPLAHLVHEKTDGNPLFAIQFMSSLAEERMVTFDHETLRWAWDLSRICAKRYTDNVVDLMIAKLARLPAETQAAVRQLACLGNTAEITTIAIALGVSEEQIHTVLWPAARQELVERLDGAYRFVHDRIQEAGYSMVPDELRSEAHLRIGRLLATHIPPEKRDATIFDIVNQLNRGAALITSQEERVQLAVFNLNAAKRAKASSAYASTLNYLAAGIALLEPDCWISQRELAFALELLRAECEFLTGELSQAAERLAALSARAAGLVELATVVSLHIEVCTTLDQSDRAVALCLDYLRRLGVQWSAHPTEDEARREYERIWSQIGDRTIEQLIDLPMMTDPIVIATMDVLTKVVVPAIFTDRNLFALIACRAVNLCLEHGTSDGSCFLYQTFGMIAGACFHNYEAGFQFGRLGYDLVERGEWHRFQARTYMTFAGLIMPWTKHILAGRDLMRRAFEAATKIGDLTFAAYSCNQLNTKLLAAGEPLVEVEREAEVGLEFAKQARFGLVIDIISAQLGLIGTLRGLKRKFGCFDDDQFNELQFERHLSSDPALALPECWYWIRKLQARFFAGDYLAAIEALSHAQRLLWTSPSFFETAEYHFYGALAIAASCDFGFQDRRADHLGALKAHHRQLEIWTEHCAETFEDRAALVGAEIARLEMRDTDAMRLYEKAIASARSNGFVHHEALAYELAARFYAARGFEEFARLYLRNARHGYNLWGAAGKVRQLEDVFSLREEEPRLASTNTIATPVEHLDLSTVIKISQAVSGEIVLETLLHTLMRTAIEQAGAERALLILPRGTEQWLEAEAKVSAEAVNVHLPDKAIGDAMLPDAVLQYVLRSRESIILDDAVAQSAFAADPYVKQHQVRSVLCMPLLNQAKLIGVLYFENNLAPRVFAPARITVLKLLASQAAISIENTRLYRDLSEREARIRRLVDANIIGIFIWTLEGQIIDANDAFLRMIGYEREDLVSGRLSWMDLTPQEWLDRCLELFVPEIKLTGNVQPFEKEYLRKNGTRVPVLVGGASFEEGGTQGVAFVLDLTERRRAEDTLSRVQMELAHANRVAAMGQLTASIAHEIRQPLAAVAMSGSSALRWLNKDPLEIEEARQAIDSVLKDTNRAANVIGRIHDFVRKVSPSKEALDINEAILEVIALTRSEAAKYGVAIHVNLTDRLPRIHGDRVQLQQLMINLIINAVQAMSDIDGIRELHISAQHGEPKEVRVAVQDTGVGISPEKMLQLFEPFYSTRPEGLGMGLSISRSIVEDHGGQLSASANVPRGAAFSFTLPAHPDDVL